MLEIIVGDSLRVSKPEMSEDDASRKIATIIADLRILARCAKSECRISYTSATILRGHGNVQSGSWLDDVYDYALRPLRWPDLTLLVVGKHTSKPSAGAFHDGRLKLSGISPEKVSEEQRRAVEFQGYEAVLGDLEPVQRNLQHSRVAKSGSLKMEQGIERAVSNALSRINASGADQTKIGKDYPDSLSSEKLRQLARRLMKEQNGRCALTGTPFDEASEVDRVSLDRIDCTRGYSEGNVQLVTIFANRARGTLDPEDARKRLIQWSERFQ